MKIESTREIESVIVRTDSELFRRDGDQIRTGAWTKSKGQSWIVCSSAEAGELERLYKARRSAEAAAERRIAIEELRRPFREKPKDQPLKVQSVRHCHLVVMETNAGTYRRDNWGEWWDPMTQEPCIREEQSELVESCAFRRT